MVSALLPLAKNALAWQSERKRISPHETVSVELTGDSVTISYGRPSLKGREVGKEVAPYGQVWRLGADEASKITVTADTVVGEKKLPAGTYTLFAIPGPQKWTMIVNKVPEQWGAFKYDQSQDLGRFDLPVQKTTSPVEEFTIALTKESDTTAKLTLAWGTDSVSTTLKTA
jgi:Protein of unknown function (DUF2911)